MSRIICLLISFVLVVGAVSACQSESTPTVISPTISAIRPATATLSIPTRTATQATPRPTEVTTTNISVASATESGCQEQTGEIASGSFESTILDKDFHYRIYFPPCYSGQPDQPYPVLYLLHGLGSDETQWESLGVADEMDRLVSSGAAQPMLIVMPRDPENKSYPLSDYPEIFINELIPYIDSHYPTQTERTGRMIGGISRGASWALRLGVSQAGMFSKIGLHSLPLEPSESDNWAEKLAAMAPSERPSLFMDSGHRDRDIDSTRSFEWALTVAGVPHTWYLFNGYHNETYWQEHLPIYLEWYTQGK